MYYNLMCVRIGMYQFTDGLPIERFMRCNIHSLLIVSVIQLFNFFSTAYPVVFQCRCLCHMACVEFTLVALLCYHCTGFIGVYVRKSSCHADGFRERGAVMGCSFQPVERDSGMLCHRDLELQLRPGDCWFTIELIICYILHKYFILSSLSLKYFALLLVSLCYY